MVKRTVPDFLRAALAVLPFERQDGQCLVHVLSIRQEPLNLLGDFDQAALCGRCVAIWQITRLTPQPVQFFRLFIHHQLKTGSHDGELHSFGEVRAHQQIVASLHPLGRRLPLRLVRRMQFRVQVTLDSLHCSLHCQNADRYGGASHILGLEWLAVRRLHRTNRLVITRHIAHDCRTCHLLALGACGQEHACAAQSLGLLRESLHLGKLLLGGLAADLECQSQFVRQLFTGGEQALSHAGAALHQLVAGGASTVRVAPGQALQRLARREHVVLTGACVEGGLQLLCAVHRRGKGSQGFPEILHEAQLLRVERQCPEKIPVALERFRQL